MATLQLKSEQKMLMANLQIDRHCNLEKLSAPTVSPGSLGINGFPSKVNRADKLFVQKSVCRIYTGFNNVILEQSNSKEFLDAIYATVALLSVETSGVDESALYLLDLIDSMQKIAIKELALSTENRFALHAVAVALLALFAMMVNVPEIDVYVESVVGARQLGAPHMLPPLHEEYNPGLDPNTPDEDVVIAIDTLKDALKSAGRDVQGMDSSTSVTAKISPRNSSLPHEPRPLLTSSASVSRRPSTVSTLSGSQIDAIDSCSSSPRPEPIIFSDDVSTKALKSVLISSAKDHSDYHERRKLKQDVYVEGKFEDICAIVEKTGPTLSEHLAVMFKNIDQNSKIMCNENESPTEDYLVMKDSEPYMKFCPQIFMY